MSRLLGILCLLLTVSVVCGQSTMESRLIKHINTAASDSQRITLMGELTRYYYANKYFQKADSLFEKQLMMAEASMNGNVVLKTYFDNIAFLISSGETKERTQSIREYINRALNFARANDVTSYTALGYSQLSAIDLLEGNTSAALSNADLGYTKSLNTSDDSIKITCAIQLGKVYQERSDAVRAYTIYSNARNIVLQSDKETLLPPIYHAVASLYRKFGKDFEAKKYIHQSHVINNNYRNIPWLIRDKIFLAKLSNAIAGKEYLKEALYLADSINNLPLIVEAERVLFAHFMMSGNPGESIKFLDERQELRQILENTGPSYLDWMLAEVYLYGNQPDSALYYFKKAEPAFATGYDLSTRKNFFEEFAFYYEQQKDIDNEFKYLMRSFEMARASSDLKKLQTISNRLKKIFEQKGDYKQAYNYSVLYEQYKDSVDLLGRERDLALLEIENVNRQQQKEVEVAKAKLSRKYSLQYMMMTIVVAMIFLLLIMIGMFKVSTTMIRIMGFLSLIFFFEFVILILDTWIHHLTHGEPWKIWVIKIGIISIILPLHHYLEHKLIHYLLSRHLITVRSKLSFAGIFNKKKKLALKVKEDLEKDPVPPLTQSQDVGGGQTSPRLK